MPQTFSRRWIYGFFVAPVSLFLGLMIATAGAAVWPQLTGLGTPLVCRGEVMHESEHWSFRPGEQGISRTVYCLTGDDAREDITVKAIAASLAVYSAIAFALLALMVERLHPRLRKAFDGFGRLRPDSTGGPAHGAAPDPRATSILGLVSDALERGNAQVGPAEPPRADPGQDPAARLALLKQLRDDGLIDAAEYEAKKAEIISGL